MYKIVRVYRDSYKKRTIAKNLTLEEAQAHCRNPETSSSKCTTPKAKAITKRNGPWFDSFDKM